MGFISQLKLMLWKHITIRKRKPITLFLEFAWPLLVFLSIPMVRHMFPESAVGDCIYRARAMPSAGLFPFMQSFMCNIGNDCYNISEYEEIPTYKEAKVGPIMNTIYPLLQRPEIQDILTHLPTTMSLASNLVSSLNQPDGRRVLTEPLHVSELFKDTELLKQYLVDNHKMDKQAADNLLMASVDVGKLIEVIPHVTVQSLVCNADILDRVLTFPPGTDVESVAAGLCPLVAATMKSPKVLQMLLTQINVRGLINRGALLLRVLGGHGLAKLLNDVGGIIDAVQNIPILLSLSSVPMTSDIGLVAEFAQQAMEFLNVLKNSPIDMNFLGELMDDIEKIAGNHEFIKHLKAAGKQLYRVIVWSQTGVLEDNDPHLVVGDLLKDPAMVKNMLMTKTDLSDEKIHNFLNVRVRPGLTSGKDICQKLCIDTSVEQIIEYEGTFETQDLLELWSVMCTHGMCESVIKEDILSINPSFAKPTTGVTVASIVEDVQNIFKHATYLQNHIGDSVKKYLPIVDMLWKGGTSALSIAYLPEWNFRNRTFVTRLASTLETFPVYLPQEMRIPVLSFLTASDVLFGMMLDVLEKSAEVDSMLYDNLVNNPRDLEKVMSRGPGLVSSSSKMLIKAITSHDAFRENADSRESRNPFCDKNVTTTTTSNWSKSSISDQDEIIQQFLCSLPVHDLKKTSLSVQLYDKAAKKIAKSILVNDVGDIDSSFNKQIRSMCDNIWRLVVLIEKNQAQSKSWGKFLPQLDVSTQNLHDASWKAVQTELEWSKYETVLNIYAAILGKSLDKEEFYGEAFKLVAQVGMMIDEITHEALSVPKELLENLTTHWTSVFRMYLDNLANPKRVNFLVKTRVWTDVICDSETLNENVDIPEHLNTPEFKSFLCQLTQFIEKKILKVNWYGKRVVSIVKKLIDDDNPGEKFRIRWSTLLDKIRLAFLRYGNLVTTSIDRVDEVDELAATAKRVLKNMNGTHLAKFSINVASVALEFIDLQLSTVRPSGWKYIKAFLGIADLLIEYIIKEMDKIIAENKLQTPSFTFGLPTLTNLTRQAIRLSEDFINVMADILTNRMGDFVGRVFLAFRNDLKPCVNVSVTDVATFKSNATILVRNLEHYACTKWKSILSELIQYPMTFKLIWKVRDAMREGDVAYDWNTGSSHLFHLIDDCITLENFNGQVFPDVEGFSSKNASMAIDRVVEAVNLNTTEKGMRFLLVAADASIPVMENIFRTKDVEGIDNMTSILKLPFQTNYTVDHQSKVLWFVLKAVLKTADIVSSDVRVFFDMLQGDPLIEVITSSTRTVLGNVFVAFPDYVATFVLTVLNPDLPLIIKRLEEKGNGISVASICSNKEILDRLVMTPRTLPDASRAEIISTICQLVSDPEMYFALKSKTFVGISETLDKVTLLWENSSLHHIHVHLVDIVNNIEFLSTNMGKIIANRTNVVKFFDNLLDERKWKPLADDLVRIATKGHLDNWKMLTNPSMDSLEGISIDNKHIVKFLSFVNGTVRKLNEGLSNVQRDDSLRNVLLQDLFEKSSESFKLASWVDDNFVTIAKTVWYTTISSPLKLAHLIVTQDPLTAFCNASAEASKYFTALPAAAVASEQQENSLESVRLELCAIDAEKLFGEIVGQVAMSKYDKTSLVPMVENLVQFGRSILNVRNRLRNQMSSLNPSTDAMASNLRETHQFNSVVSLLRWYVDNNAHILKYESVAAQRKFLTWSYNLVAWANGILSPMNSGMSLDVTVTLEKHPEIRRASRILQEHLFDVMENAAFTLLTNPLKVKQIVKENPDTCSVLKEFAQVSSTPSSNNGSLNENAFGELCSADFGKILIELEEILQINRIDNMPTVDDTDVSSEMPDADKLLAEAEKLLSTLNMLVQAESVSQFVRLPDWLDMEAWSSIGQKIKAAAQNETIIANVMLSLVDAGGWRKILLVVDKVTTHFAGHVVPKLQTSSAAAVAADNQVVFAFLENGVEMVEILLETLISSPVDKLANVVAASDPLAAFCSISSAEELSMTTADNFGRLKSAVCPPNGANVDFFSQINNFFGVSYFSDLPNVINEVGASYDADRLVANVVKISQFWTTATANSTISFLQYPALDMQKWTDVLLRLNARYSEQLGTQKDSENAREILEAVQKSLDRAVPEDSALKKALGVTNHLLVWLKEKTEVFIGPSTFKNFPLIRDLLAVLQDELQGATDGTLMALIENPTLLWDAMHVNADESNSVCQGDVKGIRLKELPLYKKLLCSISPEDLLRELLQYLDVASLHKSFVDIKSMETSSAPQVPTPGTLRALLETINVLSRVKSGEAQTIVQFQWLDADRWRNYFQTFRDHVSDFSHWQHPSYLLSWLNVGDDFNGNNDASTAIQKFNSFARWLRERLRTIKILISEGTASTSGRYVELEKLLRYWKKDGLRMVEELFGLLLRDPVSVTQLASSSDIFKSVNDLICRRIHFGSDHIEDVDCSFNWVQIHADISDILMPLDKNITSSSTVQQIQDAVSNMVQLLYNVRSFSGARLASDRWQNQLAWDSLMDRLNTMMTFSDYGHTVSSLVSWVVDSLLQDLEGQNPEKILENLQSLNVLVDVASDALNSVQGTTVWEGLRKWYSDKPRVVDFINVLDDFPRIAASVVNTALHPAQLRPILKELSMMDRKTFADFCRDLDLPSVLLVPPGSSVNFGSVKRIFCHANAWQLLEDLTTASATGEKSPHVTTTAVKEISKEELSRKVEGLCKSVVCVGCDSPSANQSVISHDWQYVTAAVAQFLEDIKSVSSFIDISARYLSLVELLPTWSIPQQFLQLTNLQVAVAVQKLSVSYNSDTGRHRGVYDILTSIELFTQGIHQIYDGLSEAGEVPFAFVLTRELEFFAAYPNESSHFCSSGSGVVVFEENETADVAPGDILQVLCREPSFRWIGLLRNNLKLSRSSVHRLVRGMVEALPAESPWSMEAKWKAPIPFDWDMMAETVRFFDHLFIGLPSEFYPRFEWPSWKKVFKTFGVILPEMITTSHDVTCPLLPPIDFQPFTDIIGVVNKQLMLDKEYQSLLCDFPRLNLTAIYRRLKYDLDLVSTLRQIRVSIGVMSLKPVDDNIWKNTCPPMFYETAKMSKTLNALVVDLVENEERIAAIKKCVDKDKQALMAYWAEDHMKVFGKAIPLLNGPNITALTKGIDFHSLVEPLMNYVKGQLPIYVPLKTILQSGNSLTESWSRSPSIATLLDGTINVNRLEATHFRIKHVADVFCHPDKLKKFLKAAEHGDDVPSNDVVAHHLCPENSIERGMEEASNFVGAVDQHHVREMLPRLQMDSMLSWKLVVSVGNKLKKLSTTLLEMKEIVGDVDINRLTTNITLRGILEAVLPVSYVKNLQKLSKGLETIVFSISPIVYGSYLEEDLFAMVNGLNGIYQFVNGSLRNFTLNVKSVIADQDAVSDLLLSTNVVDDDVVNYFLSTKINVSYILFDRQLKRLEDLFCDIIMLEQAMSMRKNRKAAGQVYKGLCNEDEKMATRMIDVILDNLNMEGIIAELGNIFMAEVASMVGVTVDSAVQAIQSVEGARQLMPIIMDTVELLQSEGRIAGVVSALKEGRESMGQNAANVIQIAGSILCGHRIRTFMEYFNLIENANDKPPPARDKKEMDDQPTEFCQSVYQQIAYRPAGLVIWGFVKPYLRGKILYAPDTEEARKIIRQANYSTFDRMAHGIDMVQSWTKGLTKLGMFVDEHLKTMEELLSLPMAQSFITGLLGPDVAENLINMSSTLDEMGSPHQLLNAAGGLGEVLKCIETNRFVGFNDEESLEKASLTLEMNNEFLGAIVFDSGRYRDRDRIRRDLSESTVSNKSGLSKHVRYKIRMDIDDIPTTKRLKHKFYRPDPEDNFLENLRYLRGFITLQDVLDRAIIELQTGHKEEEMPGVFLQQFPFPCHWKDDIGFFLRANIPTVFLLALMFAVAFFIRELVLEREMMLEQVMRVMGLKAWTSWLSWLICCVVVVTVMSVGGALILKFGDILYYSNPILLFAYFFTYCFSCIMFCYLWSVFFSIATVAAIAGVIVFFCTFVPFMVILTYENRLSFSSRMSMGLLMSTGFSQGCNYISRFEEQEIGLQLTNLFYSPIPGDTMSLGWTWIMLIVDSALYFVLASYFSALLKVISRTDKKKWRFLLFPFEFSIGKKKGGLVPTGTVVTYSEDGHNKDSKSTNNRKVRVGISLKNLRKVFNRGSPNEKVAVQSLSIDFYEGQITTLLGQNGAGKTTTINMVTGLFPPLSGSAKVYGRDVVTEFNIVRRNMGMCPQYNILFELMTVREHLEFYAKLKGILTEQRLKDDIDSMLQNMELYHRQDELAKNLSGGMKRRLCVAIAFVGGSRTIILDEPTSGVDPVARRHIWDLIVKFKRLRTILLTTHHLDEADVLSDRVAIIHKGKLLCCGSPLTLKKGFGYGYKLMVSHSNPDYGSDSDSGAAISTASTSSNSDSTTDAMAIYNFIQGIIPNAQLVEDQGTAATYCLPLNKEDGTPNSFDQFFIDLEKHQARLGISSFGLSRTSLEEVFMNVCIMADAGLPINEQGHKVLMMAKRAKVMKEERQIREEKMLKGVTADPTITSVAKFLRRTESKVDADAWLAKSLYKVHYTPLKGSALKHSQFKSLLLKRLHHTRRDWKGFITGVLLPCFFVALAMGFTLIRPPIEHTSPSLFLSPAIYGPYTDSFLKVNEEGNVLSKKIADALTGPPGIGTACLKHDPPEGQYPSCEIRSNVPEKLAPLKDKCTCVSVKNIECMALNETFMVERWTSNTTDILFNITSGSVSRYLLSTYPQFIERRYGGWTFGAKRHPPALPGTDENVVIWYNNKGHHSMPAYLNSYSNALLRANIDPDLEDPSEYGISAYNHPLHLSKTQLGIEAMMHHVADVGNAMIFLVAFSFIPTAFIIYFVKERIHEEKRLQFVSGVGPVMYWLAAYVFDVLMLVVPITLSAIVIAIFNLPLFMYGDNFVATLIMLFLFGWATIPLMYILERFFNEPSMASMVLFCVNIFVGLGTTFSVLLLFVFQNMPGMSVALHIVRYLYLIFPQYAFAGGLIELTKNYVTAEIFERFGDDSFLSPFSMKLLGLNIIVLISEGFIFFIITIILESFPNMFNWKEKSNYKKPTKPPREDPDVQLERHRVLGVDSHNDLLRLVDLTKVYGTGNKKIVAVDRVCLGVQQGECFGLLGINGAGKTTTFRMLTGECRPTHGEVLFRNQDVAKIISKGSQNVGYCPQSNALDSLLTGEEHLSIYAGLRGIPNEDIPLAVYKAVVQFNLQTHVRNLIITYSYGTRRKLNAAIAVLGNPDVVLMDEPTSGMDPATRRLVWNNIHQIVRDKRSVILTSHSMEECDTLCNRLAIMVNGRFQCLGNPQSLKHKFGEGYTITVRLQDESAKLNELTTVIQSHFPGSILKAHHCSTVEFLVPGNDSSLGDIFANLEKAKESVNIDDFSVTQTTLDQVFVNFVQQQVTDDDGRGISNLAYAFDDEQETGGGPFSGRYTKAPDLYRGENEYEVTKF